MLNVLEEHAGSSVADFLALRNQSKRAFILLETT